VALITVLPGALYTIAREHRNAAWARGDTTSRLIGFLGASAVFQALYAPLTYWIYIHGIVNGRLPSGQQVEWYWWPILLAYVLVPYLLGAITANARRWRSTGRVRRTAWWLVARFTDQAPEPRAWDMAFSRPGLTGWVRLKLKDGSWRAGPWVDSYASGYPEPQDLFLRDQAVVNQDGEFITDASGNPELTGWSLLIRWDELSYLEILEAASDVAEAEAR
jgi:hypothetical protein